MERSTKESTSQHRHKRGRKAQLSFDVFLENGKEPVLLCFIEILNLLNDPVISKIRRGIIPPEH